MTSLSALRPAFARFDPLRPQLPALWKGPFALPAALAQFYQDVGPHGDTLHAHIGPVGLCVPGVNVEIPALERLWARQAGYRWEGVDETPLAGWPAAWLVIADQYADPILLDIDSGRILFARQGAGHWDAEPLAPDLATFVAVLAAVGTVYLDADDDLHGEDDEVRPAHHAAALRAATEVLGSRQAAKAFFTTLDW